MSSVAKDFKKVFNGQPLKMGLSDDILLDLGRIFVLMDRS